ncbi:MAG: glucose-6-phosphate isomerase, partial [Pygmaiobacter sp.]
IQDGNPICFETMLDLRDNTRQCIFEHPDGVNDGFDYLDGREFTVLADAVYEGALEAHSEGGVPCLEIKCKEYNPFTFGELLYFLMYSAHVSAKLFSAFPFDQPGVEKYKTRMMCALGKI